MSGKGQCAERTHPPVSLGGGIGGILYCKQSASFYYYHYDGSGNVTSVTDGHGEEIAIYEYDSFGNVLTEAGSLANEFKFSTKQADKRGQFIDFGFRWYDPEIGRFTQRDPIGVAGGLNLYAYCSGNPVNYVDPWGLDPILPPPGYHGPPISPGPNPNGASPGPGQQPTEGGSQDGEDARDEKKTADGEEDDYWYPWSPGRPPSDQTGDSMFLPTEPVSQFVDEQGNVYNVYDDGGTLSVSVSLPGTAMHNQGRFVTPNVLDGATYSQGFEFDPKQAGIAPDNVLHGMWLQSVGLIIWGQTAEAVQQAPDGWSKAGFAIVGGITGALFFGAGTLVIIVSVGG